MHLGIKLRQWLLTGVSYMIPFVAAGGLLIALGFLLAGYEIAFNADDVLASSSITNLPDVPSGLEGGPPFDSALLYYLGAVLFQIGQLAFGFLVPALAGYIAYAIADRPGHRPWLHARRGRQLHRRGLPRRHRSAGCWPAWSPCG